jgi:hypothetical protein
MPLQRNLTSGGQMKYLRTLGYGTVMRAEARAPLRLTAPAFRK